MEALSWIGAIILALGAIGGFMTAPPMGVLALLSALVLLPPVNVWLQNRFNLRLSAAVKAGIVTLLLGGAVAYSAHLESASQPKSTKPEVDTMARAQKAERDLLARAQVMPAESLEASRDLYRQLATINPRNTMYQQKVDDYANRIRQRDAEERDLVGRFGPKPEIFSIEPGAPGVLSTVDIYLKQMLSDTTGFTHAFCDHPVAHSAKGWVVRCFYRARNQTGGITRHYDWFTIRQDQIVAVRAGTPDIPVP